MSFADRLLPRWRHSDAEIRKTAVREMTNADRLCSIAESDPDQAVREIAFGRLTDPEVLVQMAKGNGEFNVRAAGRLVEARHLTDVARHAANAEARIAAVFRLTDPLVLNQIAALDMDPSVRRCARHQHSAPDRTRDFLKAALANLEIAERIAGGVAESCGSLDDLCGAIGTDARFEINGLVSDGATGMEADTLPHLAETIAPFAQEGKVPRRKFVELLGRRSRSAGAETADEPLDAFYRIRIWRQDVNAYAWSLEERRIAMSNDAQRWGTTPPGMNNLRSEVPEVTTPIVK